MRRETENNFNLITTSVGECPDLGSALLDMHFAQADSSGSSIWADTQRWPKYEFESVGSRQYFERLVAEFVDYQLVHKDAQTGEIVGCGMSIPFHWDGSASSFPSGWDDVLALGMSQQSAGIAPNQMSALTITILPARQGTGLARRALSAFTSVARTKGLRNVFAPVRPVLKMKYPLASITDYVTWVDRKGRIFDPWLRLHHECGGRFVGLAEESVTVIATVSEWETWTGLQFPQSGDYVVPGALSAVSVDLQRNRVTYRQPNVWMAHVVDRTHPPVGLDKFPTIN